VSIQIKRVYDQPAKTDGARFLVERLWPRGMKKEALQMDGWLRDVAPGDALRKWFAHEPKKWPEFQRRYVKELDARPEFWWPLLEAARKGNVTLLYSARDTKRNSAVALKAYLEKKWNERAAARTGQCLRQRQQKPGTARR
jgi:uncharacterized protein YeaO (DUF488 family)